MLPFLLAEDVQRGRRAVARGDDGLPLLVSDHRARRVQVVDARLGIEVDVDGSVVVELHLEGFGDRPISARREDHVVGLVSVVLGFDLESVAGRVDVGHRLALAHVRAAIAYLPAREFHEFVAADAPDPGVVEQVGLVHPRLVCVEDDGFEAVLRGKQRCAQAGGAPADDGDVQHTPSDHDNGVNGFAGDGERFESRPVRSPCEGNSAGIDTWCRRSRRSRHGKISNITGLD